jgi:hypothetical protein
VGNGFGWDATFGVHRIHVAFGPHACLKTLVSPINQVAYVAKENNASILVLLDHFNMLTQRLFVYVGSAKMGVTDWPYTVCLSSAKCFGDSGYSHISSL